MTNSPERIAILATTLLIILTGCSEASDVANAEPRPTATRALDQGAATTESTQQRQPFIESDPTRANTRGATSRVIAKRDTVEGNAPACIVDFVYAGMKPESLLWEEPCSVISADMVTQRELEELRRWERLDSFDQDFVKAMPGGQVLLVGGEFSASVYPVAENGLSYEVAVAD